MPTQKTCSHWPGLFYSLRVDWCGSQKVPLKPLLLLISAIVVYAANVASADEHLQRQSPTMAEVLAGSKIADWRPLDPENTLYLEFAAGRVVIELATAFAPKHVANVKALAREHYYDGLAGVCLLLRLYPWFTVIGFALLLVAFDAIIYTVPSERG